MCQLIGENESRNRYFVLGPLRVERAGLKVDIGGLKQALLLGALLLGENRAVSVDRLIDILWGEEASQRASATLQVYVAKLRRSLAGEDAHSDIETVRPGYRMTLDAARLDLVLFRTTVRAARALASGGHLDRAAESFSTALELCRGELLADLGGKPFLEEERAAFERDRLVAVADFHENELARGRHHEVTGELDRLASDHPYDERITALLMLSLYRSGRQTDALATFKRLRVTLGEELGVEPGPDIQDLEMRILDHRPELVTSPLRGRFDAAPTVTRTTRTAPPAHIRVDGVEVPLRRTVTTIGRMPDQAVVLQHPDVSRRHAEIRLNGDDYVLVDTGSTNGTVVNGRKISEYVLESGDIIEIGDSEIVFVGR